MYEDGERMISILDASDQQFRPHNQQLDLQATTGCPNVTPSVPCPRASEPLRSSPCPGW
ncbi:hypothetical protein B0H34DRAFT_205837 [Crassisporium funariophilum]|nr:hypothetical protein B0H34DRAFT_205837 [Crassisporium funariophilum]